MKIIKDTIDIIDSDGVFWASVRFEAVISWYLFPLVFIKKSEYMQLPSVSKDGLCWVSVPHKMQIDWFLKCFCSWSRYKRLILLPYFANLHHHYLTGRFANGEYSSGIEGVFEYKKETLCSQ